MVVKYNPTKNIVGWTKEGIVIWIYLTNEGQLALYRMSPAVARKLSKTMVALDDSVRESLNDCSYSAARSGTVPSDFSERSIICPCENEQVKTIGISLSWSCLAA